MDPSMPLSHEESDIKKSFISANDEIKASQFTLPNYQSSKYTSKLIKTKEIKQAHEHETTKFRVLALDLYPPNFSAIGRQDKLLL
ncbi:45983_t:CDS:2 [Gigaspora margarita]|uniref:45983_t:CDS:1 n=1 Tax=Gigaspora margarita TaxID=4874 RepID=A0ABN7W2Y9_GIGMA|nr:45983_t:CDS:2 [Gigaspora margarita]